MIDLRSRWVVLVSCLVAVLLTAPLAGQDLPTAKPEAVGVSSEKVEELSTFMQSLVDEGKIAGGVTMMARHGKVVHLKAVGMADREEKKPMNTDSIFRIASMTKPITSVAVMMLYEEGTLGLDDPVSKYIPEFKNPIVLVSVEPWRTAPAKREITIRHLLTHTSGLGYEFSKTIGPIYHEHGISCGGSTMDLTLQQMIERLAGLPLLFDPGDRFEYGMNVDVLARVIEVVSGVSFDQFVEHEICRPLGMHDTFFRVPAEKRPRLAVPYIESNGSIRRLQEGETVESTFSGGKLLMSEDAAYSKSNKFMSGGGGLCSTPSDYMRFCQMILNGGELDGYRLLRRDTVQMMTAKHVDDQKSGDGFGLGFGVKPSTNDTREQLKGSCYWAGGWSTSFHISLRGGWVVVTMAQLVWGESTGSWFHRYAHIAADSIMDGPSN